MRKENAEFRALFESSGWSQAETARRLELDRATVSRYLDDDQDKQIPPSAPVIKLFRFILASEKAGTGDVPLEVKEGPIERMSADGAHEKLSELRAKDPGAYDLLKTSIEFLHGRISQQRPRPQRGVKYEIKKPRDASSEPTSDAQRVLKQASASSKSDPSK
jgi:transcriptional regulator with XRE-family HTH domain